MIRMGSTEAASTRNNVIKTGVLLVVLHAFYLVKTGSQFVKQLKKKHFFGRKQHQFSP